MGGALSVTTVEDTVLVSALFALVTALITSIKVNTKKRVLIQIRHLILILMI